MFHRVLYSSKLLELVEASSCPGFCRAVVSGVVVMPTHQDEDWSTLSLYSLDTKCSDYIVQYFFLLVAVLPTTAYLEACLFVCLFVY